MIYFKKSNLWIAPVAGAVIAVFVAVGTLILDNTIDWRDPPLPLFKGKFDTAHNLLSVIATSVTTLLALIFTIIVVAIQLASSQYSPRTLSTLLQDRPSHLTIGVFVGTFTYTLMILWGIRFSETVDEEQVTGVSLTLAFVFAVISLLTFAVYSNHIIHSVRVTSLINRIGQETREAIINLYNQNSNYKIKLCDVPSDVPDQIIYSDRVGVIVEIDTDGLLKKAIKSDCFLVINSTAGAFVPEGIPIINVYGNVPEKILDQVKILGERTMDKDVLFGIRQLTDMAVRANSPGINDPASSVQVLDQLHDLLRRLVKIEMGHLIVEDDDGNMRVLWKLPSWDEVIVVALDEIRINGGNTLHVVKRLGAILHDLLNIAPDDKKESLEFQLKLLKEIIEKNFENEYLKKLALEPDIRGTGF